MSDSLYETLSRVDPHVKLNDGLSIRTVQQVLSSLDRTDSDEYALFSDPTGRLLIYRLAPGGLPVRPPVFIEEKPASSVKKKKSEQLMA